VRLILGWRDLPPLPGTPLTTTPATNYRRNPARLRADQPLPRAARRQPRWPVQGCLVARSRQPERLVAAPLHRVCQS